MRHLNLTLAAAPIALVLALGPSACGNSQADSEQPQTEAGHEEGEGDHAEGEEAHADAAGSAESIAIPAASAETSGIVVATAGPGAVDETLNLTGRIMLHPSARAEVHAPYPGPVRAVLRNVGDNVRRGETLARVESAESLQTYAIVTPIAGVVLDRQTNIGDVTSDQALFVVGDLSRLQAEPNVATRDIGRISAGQRVVITGLDGATRIEAQIATVLPTADAHSQTLIARAPITISQGTPLRPGMAVRGGVVIAASEAAIAVPRDAVQTVEGRAVVFVRTSAEIYEVRPVTLGRSGASYVEILSGLAAGETYVSENAFLVKAEIGKGAASHDH